MAEVDTSSYNVKPDTPDVFERMKTFGAIAQQKIAIDQAKLKLANDHYDNLINGLSSFANQDPAKINEGAIRQFVMDQVKIGRITRDQAGMALTRIPTQQQVAQNPNAYKQYVDGFVKQAQDAKTKMNMAFGTSPQAVSNGAGTGFINTNPLTNEVNQVGGNANYIPQQLGPETLAKPEIVGVEPETSKRAGAPIMGTAAQRLRMVAPEQLPTGRFLPPQAPAPAMVPPRAAPSPAPGGNVLTIRPRQAAPPSGNGLGVSAPAPVTPPMDPGAPVPTPAANARAAGPYGELPSSVGAGPRSFSLAPGANESQTQAQAKTGGASADMWAGLQSAAETSDKRLGDLKTLEVLSNKFKSGPQADKLYNLKGSANTIGDLIGLPDKFRFNREEQAAFENFRKIAQSVADQQAPGVTDAARAGAKVSNPSTNVSNMGLHEIIPYLKGYEDYIRVKNEQGQKFLAASPMNASKYGEFSEKFRKELDPRVFQIQYMTDKEQDAYMKKLTPADRSALIAAVQRAHAARLVK